MGSSNDNAESEANAAEDTLTVEIELPKSDAEMLLEDTFTDDEFPENVSDIDIDDLKEIMVTGGVLALEKNWFDGDGDEDGFDSGERQVTKTDIVQLRDDVLQLEEQVWQQRKLLDEYRTAISNAGFYPVAMFEMMKASYDREFIEEAIYAAASEVPESTFPEREPELMKALPHPENDAIFRDEEGSEDPFWEDDVIKHYADVAEENPEVARLLEEFLKRRPRLHGIAPEYDPDTGADDGSEESEGSDDDMEDIW
jgi:hypothetical protein